MRRTVPRNPQWTIIFEPAVLKAFAGPAAIALALFLAGAAFGRFFGG